MLADLIAEWNTTIKEARHELKAVELFYVGQRWHSALGYLSPRAFEQRREHAALAT